ncbi:hypothetical protein TNCV_858761, partial [Trichonephila clavipes]
MGEARWGPQVSESPVEVGNFVLPIFIYSTYAGSPTRECSCFLLSGHQATVVSGALGLVVSRINPVESQISGCTSLHHEQNP